MTVEALKTEEEKEIVSAVVAEETIQQWYKK